MTPATDGKQFIVSTKYDANGCNSRSRLVSFDLEAARSGGISPRRRLTGVVMAGSNVCFGSTSDIFFRCVRAKPQAGIVPQSLWSYRLEGTVGESCPAIYGNSVFFLAADGYLYALE